MFREILFHSVILLLVFMLTGCQSSPSSSVKADALSEEMVTVCSPAESNGDCRPGGKKCSSGGCCYGDYYCCKNGTACCK